MSENQNRRTRDFSKYDAMSTEELENILRLDSEAPEGQESDTEEILYIAGVLAKKQTAMNTGKTALEAWESFEKNYLSTEEDHITHNTQSKKTVTPWVRRLVAAAAVIVLLIGLSSTTANAFGWEDIWNAVAKWAKETFSFVSSSNTELTEPEQNLAQEYTSLQEALAATNCDFDAIPTWIPDGYELEQIDVHLNPMQNVYVAQYMNGEKTLVITVRSYLGIEPEKIEVNEELVELYKESDTEYYIFNNNQQLCVLWRKDSFECRIAGELSMEEIKTMINSIRKG